MTCMPDQLRIVVIDPGSSKSGIGVYDRPGVCLVKSVAVTELLTVTIDSLLAEYMPEKFVVGNGTTSQQVINLLNKKYTTIPVETVDEAHSTEEARELWRKEASAHGIRRLIPRALWVPDGPLDAYVTQILADRYFKCQSSSLAEHNR